MRVSAVVILVLVCLLPFPFCAAAQEEAEGCRDHPMFTRMPNFILTACEEKAFDRIDFLNGQGEDIEVEGKLYRADYWIKKDAKAPSDLQIIRNFANAVKKIGGTVVHDSKSEIYLKLTKEGKKWWIVVDTSNDGAHYELTIVEEAGMTQDIVADAQSLMSDIQASGHASIYGIYFDFNKADIKPESETAIKEIAKLLGQNDSLKLYVVGHTDNVGSIDYNMRLSLARAKAVVRQLVSKYGVSSQRLEPYGIGPLAPVRSNRTEKGRSENRRVELVEQ